MTDSWAVMAVFFLFMLLELPERLTGKAASKDCERQSCSRCGCVSAVLARY